jgi:hypothetical protein
MRRLNLSIYTHESRKNSGETTKVSLTVDPSHAAPNLQAYEVRVLTSGTV